MNYCPPRDCAAIKTQLDAARAQYDAAIAPGIRAVRDSDGSSVEYTRGDLEAMRKRLFSLEQQYAACIGCGSASYSFVF